MLTDKAKEIKKRLLDDDRDREIAKAREQLAQNNLLGSGIESQVIAGINKKYRVLKELIDEENTQQHINRKVTPLFRKIPRYEELYRLEKLFVEVDFETYPKIAISIGNIKKESKYRPSDKKHIFMIKRTFNTRSRKKWRCELKAVRKLPSGLKLVPAK